LLDTLHGAAQLVKQLDDARFVVWLNPFLAEYCCLDRRIGCFCRVAFSATASLKFHMPNGGKAMGKLFGVPELPPHYLLRAEDIAELKQKLLAGDRSIGITGQSSAVGVQGMGGIGKTVLAAAMAYDSEVRQTFPDGIHWLTVSQNRTCLHCRTSFCAS
jgi:hypothetical protein